jgi:hypothetical protein
VGSAKNGLITEVRSAMVIRAGIDHFFRRKDTCPLPGGEMEIKKNPV